MCGGNETFLVNLWNMYLTVMAEQSSFVILLWLLRHPSLALPSISQVITRFLPGMTQQGYSCYSEWKGEKLMCWIL